MLVPADGPGSSFCKRDSSSQSGWGLGDDTVAWPLPEGAACARCDRDHRGQRPTPGPAGSPGGSERHRRFRATASGPGAPAVAAIPTVYANPATERPGQGGVIAVSLPLSLRRAVRRQLEERFMRRDREQFTKFCACLLPEVSASRQQPPPPPGWGAAPLGTPGPSWAALDGGRERRPWGPRRHRSPGDQSVGQPGSGGGGTLFSL